ncbi:tetratricopeptide repeat protein [Marinactinospora thermotolerans]|uniref:Tetratricopeptide repeat-containing protein n=1 Tax=Marinactinospora thermotolerans DSM 45154 TaxID=1122192 RepID=A0A1T4R6V4_9ACTN|nr:tetratricopeptide repeat protein [Marinactinospora thermotolerans]SKA11361.1 Tetratricopeptide repeat-containing protein [Marinactinospora thermotolerans DSM 45154]
MDPTEDPRSRRLSALVRLRRPEQAERAARELLAEAPDHPLALFALAWAQHTLGDLDGAARSAQHLVTAHPDLPYGYGWYAALLVDGHGHHAEALRYARHAAGLAPDDPWALRVLALAAMEVPGCGEEALAAATEALRLDPDAPDGHDTLRAVHCSAGEWGKAVEAARAAVALAPGDPGLRFRLGQALLRLDRHAEAGEALLSALREAPLKWTRATWGTLLSVGVPEPLRGLYLDTCAALGLPDLTVPHAAGDDPDLAQEQLDVAFRLASAGSARRAREILDALVHDQPHNPDARGCLGVLLEEAGEHERAAELLLPLVRSGHHDVDVHSSTVHALYGLGRPGDAAEVARAASELFPSVDLFPYLDAVLRNELGDRRAALAAAELTLSRNPDHPDAPAERAIALRSLTCAAEEGTPRGTP